VDILEEESHRLDEEIGQHLTAAEMRELKRLLDKVQAALTQGQETSSPGGVPPSLDEGRG